MPTQCAACLCICQMATEQVILLIKRKLAYLKENDMDVK